MEQKTLSRWLKGIIIGVGLCGVTVYTTVVPALTEYVREGYPEFAAAALPWKVFIWCSAVPCFAVLFFAWGIASNIGMDRSFTDENAKNLKWISDLAAGDALFFFVGNIVLLLLNMNHPGIVLASCVVVFAGIAVAVASASLSHLVKKAAALQEQSDLTI